MRLRTIAVLSIFALVATGTAAPADVPFEPDRVRKDRIDDSHVKITWLDVSNDEDGFEILRRVAWEQEFESRGTVGPNVTEFIDDETMRSPIWIYRVRAFNEDGDSDLSNECYVNRPRAAQPLYFHPRLIAMTTVRLRWHDRAKGERGYEVQRSDFGKNNWKTIATIDPNLEVYDDTTLSAANSYSYRIRALGRPAICWEGSKWSKTRHVTTKGGVRILQVELRGRGKGVVTSIPSRISCSPKDDHCAAEFPLATDVVLIAEPRPRSHFAGWQDYKRCEKLEDPCTVTLEDNVVIGAPFKLNR